MSYYGMPKGDWYRGDPGFFSVIGQLGRRALGAIPGLGPVAETALDILRRPAKTGMQKVGSAIIKHPVMTAAGAAGAIGAIGAGGAMRMFGGHRKCKHINPRTGKCVRRMRVTNPRALRRAIRRAHGFARLAMKTIHLVYPKKKAKFGGFKKKKK